MKLTNNSDRLMDWIFDKIPYFIAITWVLSVVGMGILVYGIAQIAFHPNEVAREVGHIIGEANKGFHDQ